MPIFTDDGKVFLANVKTDLYNWLAMPLNKNAAGKKNQNYENNV